jgi:hypothetical protein
MADEKISGMAAASALTGSELVETVQGGVNKRTTTQEIANLGGGSSILTTTITDGDTTHAPDGNAVFDAMTLKSNITPVARTGTAIQFDLLATYGTIASPETGDVTYNSTGAVIGVVQLLIHSLYQDTPTFGSEFILTNDYTPSETNYIYMELIEAGAILVTFRVEQ